MTQLLNISEVKFDMRGSLQSITDKLVIHEYTSVPNDITVQADLAVLGVMISLNRAKSIEKEIPPIYTTVQNRNTELDKLGTYLAAASNAQAATQTAGEDGKPGPVGYSSAVNEGLRRYSGGTRGCNSPIYPGDAAEYVQFFKSKIDAYNNEQQLDMNRLQSIVDKRDSSFNMASDFASGFSDTRSATIRNIGS